MAKRPLAAAWLSISLAASFALGQPATRPASRPFQAIPPEPETAGVAVYVGDELLKNYQPTPALVTKVTSVANPKFPAIDIHCHWALQQEPGKLLAAMDDLGIARAVNLSGGYGDPLEHMLARFHRAAPDRLLIFANLNMGGVGQPDFAKTSVAGLERAKTLGAAGLKVFKSLGLTDEDAEGKLIPVDDPRLDPAFDACGRLGFPVLIHSGDPTAFFQPVDERNERWMQLKRHPGWAFTSPKFPTWQTVMDQHLRMIAKHPRTVFVSAHLANCGENLARLSGWLDAHPNMYVDLSGRVPELGRQPYAARAFLLKYQDRVLFGTDRYPGRPDQPREKIYYRFLETADEYFNYYDNPFPTEGEWKIYGVFLPDEVLQKIYAANATRALAGQMPLK